MAGRLPAGWNIRCTGRVESPARFDYSRLVELASFDRDLGFGVTLTDLMASVGLRIEAEVLVIGDADGGSFGVPVRDALGDDRARLTLGGRLAPLLRLGGFPVRLDVPGWTDDVGPIAVTEIVAVDFAEFVRCP